MKFGKRIEPRTKPWRKPFHGRGPKTWGNTDQELMAEVRDLLIEIEYGQRELGAIYSAIHELAGQVAGERKAIDTLTSVADKLTEVVSDVSDVIVLRQFAERGLKQLQEELAEDVLT